MVNQYKARNMSLILCLVNFDQKGLISLIIEIVRNLFIVLKFVDYLVPFILPSVQIDQYACNI